MQNACFTGTFLQMLLLPLIVAGRLLRKTLLWTAWLVLVLAVLSALCAGVVMCVAGNVLLGAIMICVSLVVEWGLL